MSLAMKCLWILVALTLVGSNPVHASVSEVSHIHSVVGDDLDHDHGSVDEVATPNSSIPSDTSDDDSEPKLFHSHTSPHVGDLGALRGESYQLATASGALAFLAPRPQTLVGLGVAPLIRPPRSR